MADVFKTSNIVCVGPNVVQLVSNSSVVVTRVSSGTTSSRVTVATLPDSSTFASIDVTSSAVGRVTSTATTPGAASTVITRVTSSGVVTRVTSSARTSGVVSSVSRRATTSGGRVTSAATAMASSATAVLSVSRMSISLDNMTLQQCVCSAGYITKQLTSSFNTTVLVVSCQSAYGVIECVNFTCPCGARRLMASSGSVVCNAVYQAPQPFAVSQIAVALASIGFVTGVQTVELPLHQLTWNDQLSSWQPDSVAGDVAVGMIVLYVFLVGLALVVCVVILRFRRRQPIQLQDGVWSELCIQVKIT